MKSYFRSSAWIALAGVVASLAGPVAPASAAASSIQVVGQTVISPSKNSTLSVGDSLTIHACFDGVSVVVAASMVSRPVTVNVAKLASVMPGACRPI